MRRQDSAKGKCGRPWTALALSLLFAAATPCLAQHAGGMHGEGGQHYGQRGDGFRPDRPSMGGHGGQHLPQWFAAHRNESEQQQEDALRREPGFSRLPPGQQQQVFSRLRRLDMQAPAVRQRIMERNERFMALPPAQQQRIRSASDDLRAMPPDRRHAWREAFRNLRNMPPDERQQVLKSARFQQEYSPQERESMRSLLSIEPYEPDSPLPPR